MSGSSMSNVKYEIISPDEEIAMTTGVIQKGSLLSPQKKTISKGKSTYSRSWAWPVLKFLLILSLAVLIVFGILAAVLIHMGKHMMGQVGAVVIPQVTTTHPIGDLPKIHLSHDELRHVKHRMNKFHHDLIHHHDDSGPLEDLVVTERELNGLICEKDETCGHVYATILDDQVVADFSLPANDLPGGKGRYFVGTKTLQVTTTSPKDADDSSMIIHYTTTVRPGDDQDFSILNTTWSMDLYDETINLELDSAEMFGWMATDSFVQRFLKGRNWIDTMECPHAKKSIRHLAGVTIGDGKIVVHVK